MVGIYVGCKLRGGLSRIDLEHGHLVDYAPDHAVHAVRPVAEGERIGCHARHKLIGGIERARSSAAAAVAETVVGHCGPSAQGRGCCPTRARRAPPYARRSAAR